MASLAAFEQLCRYRRLTDPVTVSMRPLNGGIPGLRHRARIVSRDMHTLAGTPGHNTERPNSD